MIIYPVLQPDTGKKIHVSGRVWTTDKAGNRVLVSLGYDKKTVMECIEIACLNAEIRHFLCRLSDKMKVTDDR